MLKVLAVLVSCFLLSSCASCNKTTGFPKGMPVPDEIGIVIASIATQEEIEKNEGVFVEGKYDKYGERFYIIGEVHVDSRVDYLKLYEIVDGDVQGKGIGSFCYDPHHLIYYNSGGESVSAELCYSCGKGVVHYGGWKKSVNVKSIKPGAIDQIYRKYGLEIYTLY